MLRFLGLAAAAIVLIALAGFGVTLADHPGLPLMGAAFGGLLCLTHMKQPARRRIR